MEFPARHGRILWLLAGLLVTACLMLEKSEPGRRGAVIPHALHGDDRSLECTTCHRGVEMGDKAGMPKLAQCMLCHKAIDEQKDSEKHASSFFEGNMIKGPFVTAIPDEVKFSHQAHVTRYSVSCEQCHGKVAESTVIPVIDVQMRPLMILGSPRR